MHPFFSSTICLLLWGVIGCHPGIAQRKKAKYHESLHIHHKHYNVTSDQSADVEDKIIIYPHNQSYQVDSITDVLAYEYSKYKKSRGYRILIYSGSDEDLAIEAQKKLRELKVTAYGEETTIFQEIPIYPKYNAPNFKILVGDYISKLLAFQMLLQLNDEFPKALLIPVDDVKLENID